MPGLDFGPQLGHRLGESPDTKSVSQGDKKPVRIQGLFEEVVSTAPGCFHGCVDRPVPRDHHHLIFGSEGSQPIQDF